MKKARKFLAMLIASVMVLSMSVLTAFASDTPPADTTYNGTGELSGTGTAIVGEVYRVVLPTDENFNFILDVYGFAGVGNNETASLEDLEPFAGKIVHAGSPATVINESSVALKMDVTLTVTGDANVITTATEIEDDTDANVVVTAAAAAGSVNSVTTKFEGGAEYILNDTGATLEFVLGAAEYEVTRTAGGGISLNLVPKSGNGTQFQIGGLVSKLADWNDFFANGGATPGTPGTVGVSALFHFAKATSGEVDAADVDGVYGLKVNGGLSKFTGGGVTGFTSPTGTSTAGNWGVFDFVYNGLTVMSVTANGTLGTLNSNYTVDYANNTISLKYGSANTRAIVVTLSDGSTYNFTLTTT